MRRLAFVILPAMILALGSGCIIRTRPAHRHGAVVQTGCVENNANSNRCHHKQQSRDHRKN